MLNRELVTLNANLLIFLTARKCSFFLSFTNQRKLHLVYHNTGQKTNCFPGLTVRWQLYKCILFKFYQGFADLLFSPSIRMLPPKDKRTFQTNSVWKLEKDEEHASKDTRNSIVIRHHGQDLNGQRINQVIIHDPILLQHMYKLQCLSKYTQNMFKSSSVSCQPQFKMQISLQISLQLYLRNVVHEIACQ